MISDSLEVAADNESFILSDLFGALTNNKCKGLYFHEDSYWENSNKLGSEAYAHFFEVSVTNNTTRLEIIKSVFPNSFSIFLDMVGENNHE